MITTNGFPKFYEMDNNLFVKIYVDPKDNKVYAVTNKGKKFPSIGVAMSEGKAVTEKEFTESTRQR